MVQTSIPVFAEQSYMSSIWFSRSILGIKTAAKMLRVNCILIKNIDEFIKLEDEINSVIIISSKADWTHNIISQLRKMNLKLILTGATPSEFGEDIQRHGFESQSSGKQYGILSLSLRQTKAGFGWQ